MPSHQYAADVADFFSHTWLRLPNTMDDPRSETHATQTSPQHLPTLRPKSGPSVTTPSNRLNPVAAKRLVHARTALAFSAQPTSPSSTKTTTTTICLPTRPSRSSITRWALCYPRVLMTHRVTGTAPHTTPSLVVSPSLLGPMLTCHGPGLWRSTVP